MRDLRLAGCALLLLAGCLRPNPHADLLDGPAPARPDARRGDCCAAPGDRSRDRTRVDLARADSRPPDAQRPREGPTPPCSAVCPGCCLAGGQCVAGQSNSQCGVKGASCADCAAAGQVCVAGSCVGICSAVCFVKKCWEADACGGLCKPESGCTPCSFGTTGENSDPCPGVPAETWRCVWSAKLSSLVSQVCRSGIWQTYHAKPKNCAACCGSWAPGCA